MARAAEFEKAWRLAYTKTDYSLIESLLHRDYQMYDHRMGMQVDFETEKSLIETLCPFLTMGPWKILYENEEVYAARLFTKYKENRRFGNKVVRGIRCSDYGLMFFKVSAFFRFCCPFARLPAVGHH